LSDSGITPEFCTPSKSSTGAPGTAAPGTNGCISNCGTDVVKSPAPAEFLKVGYFQAYNHERPCLNMRADQIPEGYSHVHFSFGGITDDFQVDMTGMEAELQLFSEQTHFKRILAFGGWSFSTDADSAPIFRDGVTAANRLTFARSIVRLLDKYKLDGVDFDWEYPGATDIPGAGAGSPSDGANYLAFLRTMRSQLPAGKTIGMAAPASYWYLRGFPIADMAPVLDYIVYMTYDLHGQWDYGSNSSQEGCLGGNCLRSHVNLTETNLALAMITKAGVPANKIAVGIASYGRSFKMVNRACRGPSCFYTGPSSGAQPGACTNTAGYIAQAELEQFLGTPGTRAWYDAASDSDMMQYGPGGDTWAAYMSENTKASRTARYRAQNFGGTAEWAIDLAGFVEGDDDDDDPTTTVTSAAPTGSQMPRRRS
jgi:GH18 family chitinase